MKTPNTRVRLFGVEIDNLNLPESITRVSELIESDQTHQHVVINVDKAIKLSNDPQLREIINNCSLVNADGMPIVWASKLVGKPLKERVAGIDLFEALVAEASKRQWPVYFLGAREEVVNQVINTFKARHPELPIAGYRNGYWEANQEQAVINDVCTSGAKLLFVAISSPKKEQLLAAIQSQKAIAFAMGVGGSFDIVAGRVQRAPVWMQRSGLEWFYRFIQEPARLFKRYFVDAFKFLNLVLHELKVHRRLKQES
jgi:N-acetylglucosaminyldiphosphoundecaprenol N-acetyl-beta-D-mannosaminyltransferase